MSPLNNSTKQAFRLAAVGALLHNLGKIHAKFLDKKINSPGNNYLYQHIVNLIAPYVSQLPNNWQSKYSNLNASAVLDSKTVDALKTAFNLPAPLDDRSDYTVGDLIEYLGAKEPWYQLDNGKFGIEYIFPGGSRLTHLMNRAHHGASGGEKEAIATAQQPDATDLYLSTPFGYETAAPNINNINNLLQQIEAAIQKYLLPPANPLPLSTFIADIRPLLGQAIADTQRPLNDVTVGDIGHTGMAFLLTQAAEWILTGRVISHTELAKKKADNTLFWRVLTVHTDSLRYLKEAVSLADLRVRQRQLQETFQKVSQELEETLLAVEIYADEQRRLFVVPNLNRDHPAYQTINNIVAEVDIDGLRLTKRLSDPVTNHPLDKGGDYIGDVVLQQLQEAPPYDFDANTVAGFWSEHTNGRRTPICTACNLRPQGYGAELVEAYKHNPKYYRKKAEERKICCVCMERRSGVAQKWAESELNTTVWTNEVADSNGRLALIVGHWSLEHFSQALVYPLSSNANSKLMWLHTVRFLNNSCPDQHTFTLNGQTYSWQTGSSTLSGPRELASLRTNISIHAPSQMSITVQDVTVAGEQLSLTVEEDLTEEFAVGSQVKCLGQDFRIADTHSLVTVDDTSRQKILSNVLWDTTYPFVVQKATKVNVLEITSPGDGAKSESFARLRRIWQTTQTFWETILDEPNHVGDPLIPQVLHRFKIVPQNREQLDLGHYHAYDLKLTNSVKLSVVWDSQRKLFITCDNLEYLAKPELLGKPVIEFLKGELTLEEPTGYGSQNKTWGKIIIEEVAELENSNYTPIIPILAEPRTFMVLVPADKAMNVVRAIKAKYEREMGKVRNRLPLHLGVAYASRRTPLRVVLDAGRRMLKQGMSAGEWKVEDVRKQPDKGGELPSRFKSDKDGQFKRWVEVVLERGRHRITWYVPVVMGDGKTPDHWYPYVFLKTSGELTDHERRFQAPNPFNSDTDANPQPGWLVHVGDLKENDVVYFTPATLDFQWLDSSARRFEIAYGDDGQRLDPNLKRRPYLLDELTTLETAWQLVGGRNGLTRKQIHALRDLIEAKREEWQPLPADCKQVDGVFWKFCRDALLNAQWPKDHTPNKEVADQLTTWAVSGLLTDAIELHMQIMKDKPEVQDDSG